MFIAIENSILRMIAEGQPLHETMGRLCQEVERAFSDVTCTVLSVDRAGLLNALAGPSLPRQFAETLDGLMIGPKVGSCGSAAYLRAPVEIGNIESDSRWERYKNIAMSIGLRACCSSPVLDDHNRPIGVVTFYFTQPRKPSDAEREAMAACVRLCEIALRRHERVMDRERRATVDTLTGLPNRAAFNAVISTVPADEPGAWALLAIDLDNLKVVNDTFGHQAGDALIRTAATRVAKSIAPDVAFRLGGDEFAVLIQDRGALSDLDATAARIFQALEAPAECDGHTIIPKATIGAALPTPGDTSSAAVAHNADIALYHAKETGRGGFVRYWPGIGTRMTRRRDAIRDVSVALEDGRIDAFYQPVVRLDSNEIVGVEALWRVRAPDGRVIAANHLQDATTDARIAAAITDRMLSFVAGTVRKWLDARIPLQHVGLNISTVDFHGGSLISRLEENFGRKGVPLSHLIIEVSEDVCVGHRDKVIAREIRALRDKGVRVALDNFGTGYASLTHLLDVPVDTLKIDRTIISRLQPNDPSSAITRGIIEIALNLGITLVAEGIETEVQANQLRAMGCKLGQGELYSPPVDLRAAGHLLQRHAQGIQGAIPMRATAAYAASTDEPFDMVSHNMKAVG